MIDQRFAHGYWALLGANATAANHHKVLVDQSIVREPTLNYSILIAKLKISNHWIDGLGGHVIVG